MRVCGLYAGQISRRVAGAADWWAWCGLKDKEWKSTGVRQVIMTLLSSTLVYKNTLQEINNWLGQITGQERNIITYNQFL